MKAEELAAIKGRADNATSGNWQATLDDPYERTYVLGAFDGVVTVIADIKGDADAQFIAHAREDIPKLVAEVESLLQQREDLLEVNERIQTQLVDALLEVERLQRQISIARRMAEVGAKYGSDLLYAEIVGTLNGVDDE